MMNRTFRRLTAVLLTLCMALTLLPVSAFAEGETQGMGGVGVRGIPPHMRYDQSIRRAPA